MLGEAALTAADARRYCDAYADRDQPRRRASVPPGAAILRRTQHLREALGAVAALRVRASRTRAVDEVAKRLLALAAEALRGAGVGLTVDAEEADRLELSLAIFARVHGAAALRGLAGSRHRRAGVPEARAVRCCAGSIGSRVEHGRRIPVRLVKGAYWDSEIKHAQARGHAGYPVFTRKHNTDLAYLACAKALLTEHAQLRSAVRDPQRAQRGVDPRDRRRPPLRVPAAARHGRGAVCGAACARPASTAAAACMRRSAGHRHLLPYLVRRLLENGANTSFVNRLVDAEAPIDALVADPFALARDAETAGDPRIPPPAELFAPERRNSRRPQPREQPRPRRACGRARATVGRPLGCGADGGRRAVAWDSATNGAILPTRRASSAAWTMPMPPRLAPRSKPRAAISRCGTPCLPNGAPSCSTARHCSSRHDAAELVARCVAETGRTVADALDEIRETVDLLRYYAAQCRAHFAAPRLLPGPTGERNELLLRGRGVFVCISPWNFPVAIFAGQIAAALAAGNTVIAKPAEQASLTAARVVALLDRGRRAARGAALPYPATAPRSAQRCSPTHAWPASPSRAPSATAQAINRTLAHAGRADRDADRRDRRRSTP